MQDPREAVHGGRVWQRRIVEPGSYAEVVCADVNDAWYPPAPGVLETLVAWLGTVNHSPDTTCGGLREALSEWLEVGSESIAVGSGSSDLLHGLIASVAGEGDEVVVTDPTYAEYARSAAATGARVARVALREEEGFTVTAEAVLDRVTAATRLVVLCNPNNPTGRFMTREEVCGIAGRLPASVFLLVDEAYIDYGLESSVIGDVERFENMAVVRTFSKAYGMAGLRIGYAVMGESVRRRFARRVRPPWPVPMISMAAARVAMRESGYVRARVAETLALKAGLVVELRGIAGVRPVDSGTHYFLADIEKTGLTGAGVVETLQTSGVYVRDCVGFGETMDARWVRVTTQGPEGNARIVAAFGELQDRRATA
jgi:histidinol-phosphate aminotransferase